jgi:hypothetical protein
MQPARNLRGARIARVVPGVVGTNLEDEFEAELVDVTAQLLALTMGAIEGDEGRHPGDLHPLQVVAKSTQDFDCPFAIDVLPRGRFFTPMVGWPPYALPADWNSEVWAGQADSGDVVGAAFRGPRFAALKDEGVGVAGDISDQLKPQRLGIEATAVEKVADLPRGDAVVNPQLRL